MPDFYEVLQVHPSAEPEVIRAAYRILARKYHPDHGGDARRMVVLNDAWDVLGDKSSRFADRHCVATRGGRPGGGHCDARFVRRLRNF
jgi:curved DNA-binding protein CbpA